MAHKLKKEYPKKWSCHNCGKEHPFRGYSYSHKYCDNICQKEFENKQRVQCWLYEGVSWGTQVPNWAKRYLAETRGYACEICGIKEWNSQPIVLECDHIDGDHKNNRPENLRLICPNCHSQTDTYKAKNTGNGRTHRRLTRI